MDAFAFALIDRREIPLVLVDEICNWDGNVDCAALNMPIVPPRPSLPSINRPGFSKPPTP